MSLRTMKVTLGSLHILALVAGWVALGVVVFLRRRFQSSAVLQRDRRSFLGTAIQGVGFAAVFSVRRKLVNLPINNAGLDDVTNLLAGMLLLACSVWMLQAAISALGKQWSLTARVLEEHTLVTSGPYGLVRHPIYTAMFGMLLGSGILVSRWESVVVGAAFFLWGTVIRVRIEERLLRAVFGTAYENYARKVPALIPRWPSP